MCFFFLFDTNTCATSTAEPPHAYSDSVLQIGRGSIMLPMNVQVEPDVEPTDSEASLHSG